MPLDRNNTSLLTGERKELLERHRKNNVPRFLFRAFNPASGGGPRFAINDTESVRPHAYVSGRVPAFYRTPENELYELASAHYCGDDSPPSRLSSWAASLHLVLYYAHTIGPDGYVAVIDREKLKNDVLIWHAPHLISRGIHEYLAYGVINGAGYKAVTLTELSNRGLYRVFPELTNLKHSPGCLKFGHSLRFSMFRTYKPHLGQAELATQARNIANAFGELWFPVATALVCIRPQPWFKDRRRSAPSSSELHTLLCHMGIQSKPSWLKGDVPWLQHCAVETGSNANGFPDVKQWIDLLSAIAHHPFHP